MPLGTGEKFCGSLSPEIPETVRCLLRSHIAILRCISGSSLTVYARAFTQRSVLLWNPQTRFSCQCTMKLFFAGLVIVEPFPSTPSSPHKERTFIPVREAQGPSVRLGKPASKDRISLPKCTSLFTSDTLYNALLCETLMNMNSMPQGRSSALSFLQK